MKKLVLGVLALAMILSMGGCRFVDGDIYGKIENDGGTYYNTDIGGFPSAIAWDTSYRVWPGTYTVRYTEYNYGHFYPGYYWYGLLGDNTSYVWNYQYTVDGYLFDDQYFTLYLYYNGLQVFGTDRSLGAKLVVDQPGTYTYTEDGLTITVKASIEKCEPGDQSQPATTIISK